MESSSVTGTPSLCSSFGAEPLRGSALLQPSISHPDLYHERGTKGDELCRMHAVNNVLGEPAYPMPIDWNDTMDVLGARYGHGGAWTKIDTLEDGCVMPLGLAVEIKRPWWISLAVGGEMLAALLRLPDAHTRLIDPSLRRIIMYSFTHTWACRGCPDQTWWILDPDLKEPHPFAASDALVLANTRVTQAAEHGHGGAGVIFFATHEFALRHWQFDIPEFRSLVQRVQFVARRFGPIPPREEAATTEGLPVGRRSADGAAGGDEAAEKANTAKGSNETSEGADSTRSEPTTLSLAQEETQAAPPTTAPPLLGRRFPSFKPVVIKFASLPQRGERAGYELARTKAEDGDEVETQEEDDEAEQHTCDDEAEQHTCDDEAEAQAEDDEAEEQAGYDEAEAQAEDDEAEEQADYEEAAAARSQLARMTPNEARASRRAPTTWRHTVSSAPDAEAAEAGYAHPMLKLRQGSRPNLRQGAGHRRDAIPAGDDEDTSRMPAPGYSISHAGEIRIPAPRSKSMFGITHVSGAPVRVTPRFNIPAPLPKRKETIVLRGTEAEILNQLRSIEELDELLRKDRHGHAPVRTPGSERDPVVVKQVLAAQQLQRVKTVAASRGPSLVRGEVQDEDQGEENRQRLARMQQIAAYLPPEVVRQVAPGDTRLGIHPQGPGSPYAPRGSSKRSGRFQSTAGARARSQVS